jgi:hypothetical protein
MENLICQAFAHVSDLAEHVEQGHYDLLGPDGEIIMPEYWESSIEPDMSIRMMLWEIKKEEHMIEEIPPPGDDGILNLDDILNPGASGGGGGGRRRRERRDPGGGDDKEKKKRQPSKDPGAFSRWMLGAPKKSAARRS